MCLFHTGDHHLDHFLCGEGSVTGYSTSGEFAYVEFITDGSTEGKGFKINYWTECKYTVG